MSFYARHSDRPLQWPYTLRMAMDAVRTPFEAIRSLWGFPADPTIHGLALSACGFTAPEDEITSGSVVASHDDFRSVYDAEKARWAEVVDRLK